MISSALPTSTNTDYLSEVLGSVKLRVNALQSQALGAPWSLTVPESQDTAQFYVVTSGSCWLSVSGINEHYSLAEGDLILLTQGSQHVLRDHPRTLEGYPQNFLNFDSAGQKYRLASPMDGDGSPTRLIVGAFELRNTPARQLFSPLPHLMSVSTLAETGSTRLRSVLELLCAETNVKEPGAGIVSERLADLLLVEILRAFIIRPNPQVDLCPRRMGILTALLDPEIGAVTGAVIKLPSASWTVESMAYEAGMSRTAFAVRFAKLAGVPPLEFLTSRRMELAKELLEESSESLESIARTVGYQSTSALYKAFLRETGMTPSQCRSDARSRRNR